MSAVMWLACQVSSYVCSNELYLITLYAGTMNLPTSRKQPREAANPAMSTNVTIASRDAFVTHLSLTNSGKFKTR